jgi:DNA (cytosine-5)-methyltransferase 1
MDTRTLSICSGYGGIELGLRAVIPRTRVVCYVENEVTQSQILGARIRDGVLDDAPIWTDLRTFDAKPWRGKVDIVTGGFPCQPHSVAGQKRGADDPRELSGDVLRIADELGRPTLFLENVPGIRRFYWDNIRPRLQEMGYRTEEVLVTARETGAPHKRQRLFIMANAGYPELSGWFQAAKRFVYESRDQLASQDSSLGNNNNESGKLLQCKLRPEPNRTVENMVDTISERLQGNSRPTWEEEHVQRSRHVPLYPPGPDDHEGWTHVLTDVPSLEPTFCRVAHGSTPWVDKQLRSIGNGVVPASAARAFLLLSKRFE